MAWHCVSFDIEDADPDAIGDALLAAGASSVEVADADAGTPDERPAFGEPGAAPPAWPRSRLNALFPADVDAIGAVSAACAAAGVAVPHALDRSVVADLDWVRASRSQFQPVHVGGRLWVVPSWETAPEPDAVNLMLDPGAAFGTGTHPTTRGCLRWLEANLRGGETVLDYGCGSGILAIAALRLGAARARGVDVDPLAVEAARENAARNAVEADFHLPDTGPEPAADVVLANILANPLIALAPLLAKATAPGGRIVLSGILAAQAGDVRAAYAPWFDFEPDVLDEDWALLVGRRLEAGR